MQAHRWFHVAVLVSSITVCTETNAQQIVIPPAGVYIDANGVLQARETGQVLKPAKGKGRRPDSYLYISLPRLLEEVQRRVTAGEPITDELRYFGGIVRLQHVFAFPEEKDLVIGGPAESFYQVPDARPVGEQTGSPLLCLDDFATCLRAIGNGRGIFGCTIELPSDAQQRIAKVAPQIGVISNASQLRRAQTLYAQAVGPQTVRLFGISSDNYVARACVEADFIMKRLALGLQPSPVRGVSKQKLALNVRHPTPSRFWFTAYYEPLLVSQDGNSYEIRGQALKVKASGSPTDDDVNAPAGARRFAEQLTDHFEEMSRYFPQFVEMRNAMDLSVLAALILQDGLARRCNVNLEWLRSDYPVPKVELPQQVETVVVASGTAGKVQLVLGGVAIAPITVIEDERDTAPTFSLPARRPENGQWFLRTTALPTN